MISIKFLDNNLFLVSFNGKFKDFNSYANKIYKNFSDIAILDKGNGWIFHHNYLNKVIDVFKDVKYLNEYIKPPYVLAGCDLKYEPYDYQKEAIYYGLQSNNSLLVLPCGSGKTIIGIGIYAEALKNKIIDSQGLIIVKASLKTQWKNEINKFSDFTSNILRTYSDICAYQMNKIKKIDKEIESTKNKKKIATLNKKKKELILKADENFNNQFKDANLLIANYETLCDENVVNTLLSRNIEYIMCDEIHYIKTPTAERSKALYKLTNTKIKIGATATPILKDPRDVFGIYNFLCPDLFESYSKFQRRYINFAGYGRINGFKNQDELKKKITDHIFVKTKNQISSQLPKLNVIPIRFNLTNSQNAMFENIEEELKKLNLDDKFIRGQCKSENEAMLNKDLQTISGKIMALQTFAQELTDSPVLMSTSDSEYSKKYIEGINLKINPKLDVCLEIVSQILSSGEKVCIFSKFERMQKILTEAINKMFKDIKIAYINGSLSSDDRYIEAYDKFRDNNEYKVLLLSDAGAEGLNLSKCKYMIEYDLSNSYAIQTQRHGRLERADSIHEAVTVYQLIANNSWDTVQEKIISKKKQFDDNIIKNISSNV